MNEKRGTPGIYRTTDLARVAQADAMAAWATAARDELMTIAKTYNATMTYAELGRRVQDASGIRTRVLLANWIGRLLEEVARRAADRGEPPLTSLCVHQDGTIGAGYARAPKSNSDPITSDDIEYFAAEHRLFCYRAYAMDLPADGGRPMLTALEQARRDRSKPQPGRDIRICPGCFLQLPSSGTCSYCD